MTSHVISINAGKPREVDWHGRPVLTSIWKAAVAGPVIVKRLNLDGDQQSDLTVHGGEKKAVYVYPSEHYGYWRSELPGMDLPWGAFGENFTTAGLLEENILIGARLHIGSADFLVTQPRTPCFKLGIRFGRPEMVRRFLVSRRSGFYLSVLKKGLVGAGDAIEFRASEARGITVSDVVSLYSSDAENQELLRRASELAPLPEAWRDYFRKRLWKPDA